MVLWFVEVGMGDPPSSEKFPLYPVFFDFFTEWALGCGWMDGFALWFIAYTSLSRDSSEATPFHLAFRQRFRRCYSQEISPPQWRWCIHKSPCNAIGANRTVFTVFLVFAARGQAFKCIVWTLRKEYTIWPWEKEDTIRTTPEGCQTCNPWALHPLRRSVQTLLNCHLEPNF